MNNDHFLIELKDVCRSYNKDGEKVVGVRNINFKVKRGEVIALVGPSGCGKTTILRMIADIIQPDSGSILYNGQTIDYARHNGLLGYVPQLSSLIKFRTVFDNIKLPLELKKVANLDRVKDLIKLCSLNGFEKYFPAQLSGGMKQRAAIARALSTNPEVLLMDEPFASLDEMIKEKLNEEVLRIQSTLGTTILYVTHNIEEAVFLANKVVVLSKEPGTIIDIVDINLPAERNSILRNSTDFFQEVIKVRRILKNI